MGKTNSEGYFSNFFCINTCGINILYVFLHKILYVK